MTTARYPQHVSKRKPRGIPMTLGHRPGHDLETHQGNCLDNLSIIRSRDPQK